MPNCKRQFVIWYIMAVVLKCLDFFKYWEIVIVFQKMLDLADLRFEFLNGVWNLESFQE